MKTWVVGNWKMHGSLALIDAFVPALLAGLKAQGGADVGLCPPFPYLPALSERLNGTPVALGAQKVHPLAAGAYTGEVSPAMLREFGVSLCIVGHSERRQLFGMADPFIAESLHALWEAGIRPVLCVGETQEERQAGQQQSVIERQLTRAFSASAERGPPGRRGESAGLEHPAISAEHARRLIVAYEPVWAIGTGVNATPEQANEMHAFIRRWLSERLDAQTAEEIPLLYGGSVNPDNAAALSAQPEINGTLVGGASLKPESFLSIIEQSSH